MERRPTLSRKPSQHELDEQIYEEYCAAKASGNPYRLSMAEAHLARNLRRIARAILWTRLSTREVDLCYELADLAVAKALLLHEQFEGRSRFTTYFYRLVVNALNTHLTAKSAFRRPRLVNVSDMDLSRAKSESLDTRILLQQVRAQLSPADQRLFDYKLEGWTDREICRELGLRMGKRNNNEVYRKWKKLKLRLRELLSGGGAQT